jgi:hypothetical protein
MWKPQAIVTALTIAASLGLGPLASRSQEDLKAQATEPQKEKPAEKAPPPTAEDMLKKMQEQESGVDKPSSTGSDPTGAESNAQKTPTTAEELLRVMQEQKPAPRVVAPWSLEGGGGAGDRPERLLPEGDRISRRVGRLVLEGQWWTFAFESDHQDHPEPRLGVLPNLVLETMARTVESGSPGVVWVISGEVTEFRNRNYILIRDAQRRSAGGNLRP